VKEPQLRSLDNNQTKVATAPAVRRVFPGYAVFHVIIKIGKGFLGKRGSSTGNNTLIEIQIATAIMHA